MVGVPIVRQVLSIACYVEEVVPSGLHVALFLR